MRPQERTDRAAPDRRGKNAENRGILFRYLDGFPIAPTITALNGHAVLELFRASQTMELADIVRQSGGNEGYLQVALRLLCSQGWLVQTVDSRTDTIRYTTTRQTAHAFSYAGEPSSPFWQSFACRPCGRGLLFSYRTSNVPNQDFISG